MLRVTPAGSLLLANCHPSITGCAWVWTIYPASRRILLLLDHQQQTTTTQQQHVALLLLLLLFWLLSLLLLSLNFLLGSKYPTILIFQSSTSIAASHLFFIRSKLYPQCTGTVPVPLYVLNVERSCYVNWWAIFLVSSVLLRLAVVVATATVAMSGSRPPTPHPPERVTRSRIPILSLRLPSHRPLFPFLSSPISHMCNFILFI